MSVDVVTTLCCVTIVIFGDPGNGSFDLSKFCFPRECFCKNPFPEERPVMVEGRSIVTASTSGNKGYATVAHALFKSQWSALCWVG